jgi:hypothetical protein
MALIYLLSALVFGVALVRRIPFALYRFEAAAMSVVLGLFGWMWMAFLGVMVLRYDIALPIVVTVAAAATLALWPGGKTPEWRPLEGGRPAWAAWGVATAVTSGILLRLFWTHSLVKEADGLFTGGATWGDYGAHASYISHIAASTGTLPSDLPIAAGEKITYPFLIDMLSALYIQGGMSLHAALFWPGVLLAICVCQLLMTAGLRLFERISVGIGGMVLALTMGSAAGAWTAWDDWRESGKGLFAFLGKLPSDYSEVLDKNAHVTNMVADALLPQRAILFGLALGLILLTFLHTARERGDVRLLWPAAVIVGLLPMTHAHTFLVGMALFVTVAAEAAWHARKVPVAYLKPIGLALLLAAPQLAWQQTANGRGTGGRFRFGWMVEEGHSLLGFYWINFGVFGIALLAIPFVLRRHRQILWMIPMFLILLISQLYAFQPFEYDNLKLISWAFVIAGFFIAYMVSQLVRRHRAWLAVVIPVGLFVITPGALAITREFQLHDQFASPPDIEMAKWVTENTPVDAVFASTDRSNNPVSTLAGRRVILGYRGWLFSYNIPYTERENAVKAALAGRTSDPALRKFGADYLVVNTSEDPSWPVDNDALASTPVVWSNQYWRIFKLP